ncbi:reductase VcaE [Tamaricihabitans halophyticus]|uniref:Reductase VcaE n=1 Tax=Tamaricihabitans halophyticus TaxID=1262583 RepID=A0A4R2QWD9_9PSEU|nr:NAD-dependent epimerase/dehydratase family protein [Tamaricihabitans halophyticus]TCP53439.1 reductase VcaE [Tamaricihabitans halophyticus]
MSTVTVLGAGGFLGSAVTRMLLDQQIRLKLIARRPLELPADAAADVSVHVLDATDPDALAPVLLGSDVILFMIRPSWDWRRADATELGEAVNVGPMRTIIQTFAGRAETPLCVYAGSTGQTGTPPEHPMDGTEIDMPNSDYERQKYQAERLMFTAHREGILRAVSLRLCMVFGQQAGGGTDPGIVRLMGRRALAGNELTVWGDGTVTRDLLYVRDCAEAFRAVLDAPEGLLGRHWVVGSGEAWSLTRLFGKVAESVGRHTDKPPVPVVSVPPPEHAVSADAHSVFVNPEAFQRVTGWRARTSVEAGVDETVAVLASEFMDEATATEPAGAAEDR